MIQVEIQRSPDGSITAYRVSGHAEYAESGKDIVCAGVSAVAIGMVNAVEAQLNIRLLADMRKGWLDVTVPDVSDQALADKLQLLLESMVVMLQSIQQSYGEYVNIQTTTLHKRR